MISRHRFMPAVATVAFALAFAVSGALACEDHAQAAADGKNAKEAKPAAAVAAKGCDLPCCAKKAAAAVEARNGADAVVAPVAAVNGDAKAEAPCAAVKDGKGCPKKSAETKAEPATKAPQAEPAASAGASR